MACGLFSYLSLEIVNFKFSLVNGPINIFSCLIFKYFDIDSCVSYDAVAVNPNITKE